MIKTIKQEMIKISFLFTIIVMDIPNELGLSYQHILEFDDLLTPPPTIVYF